MKVFLTGGTGFIGTHLTQALVKRGWQVTVLTRTGTSPETAPTGLAAAQGVKGDVTDPESLRAAMVGADLVIHNAGWYEIGLKESDKAKMQAINVEGTRNVLALAQELKIPKVVYTSSTTAFGDTSGQMVDETFERTSRPITYYEETKTEAHAIAREYQAQGLPLVIACPAQVIGPGDHSAFGWYAWLYVRSLLPPIIWAPEGTFTFGYVEDVAEGLALVAEKGRAGETYFLGGGTISLRGLMPVWKQAVGGIPPFIWLPKPLALVQGMLVEPILHLLGVSAFISREVVEGSFVSYQFSSEKAKRELGWQPRTVEQAWIDTLRAEKAKK
jgi:nucleoside-diphosphate-sugar epimerase